MIHTVRISAHQVVPSKRCTVFALFKLGLFAALRTPSPNLSGFTGHRVCLKSSYRTTATPIKQTKRISVNHSNLQYRRTNRHRRRTTAPHGSCWLSAMGRAIRLAIDRAILLASCVLSVVFASSRPVLSTRPRALISYFILHPSSFILHTSLLPSSLLPSFPLPSSLFPISSSPSTRTARPRPAPAPSAPSPTPCPPPRPVCAASPRPARPPAPSAR
jgi:hypothetical protein